MDSLFAVPDIHSVIHGDIERCVWASLLATSRTELHHWTAYLRSCGHDSRYS